MDVYDLGAKLHDQTRYRSLLVGITSYVNAAVSAFELQREMSLYGTAGPQVVFGVYDFETLRVQSGPVIADDGQRLRPAPRSAEELANYASQVVEELMSLDDGERDASYMLTMRA